MPAHEAEQYWKAIDVLEAQETLIKLKAADFPTMKQGARSSLYKQLHKQAYPKVFEKPIVIDSPEQLARILNG